MLPHTVRHTRSPRSGHTANMRWWRWRCKHSTLNFHENYSQFFAAHIQQYRYFSYLLWVCLTTQRQCVGELTAFSIQLKREKCVLLEMCVVVVVFLFFLPRRWISLIAACVSFAQILAYIVGGGLRCHPNCVRSMVSSRSTCSIQRLQHSG